MIWFLLSSATLTLPVWSQSLLTIFQPDWPFLCSSEKLTYIKPQGLSPSKSPHLENSSCLCKADSAYWSGLRQSISFFRANFLAISNVDPIVTTSLFSFIFKSHLTLVYTLLFISPSPSYSLLYFVHHFVYKVHSRHSTDILKWINKSSLHLWINRCVRSKNW